MRELPLRPVATILGAFALVCSACTSETAPPTAVEALAAPTEAAPAVTMDEAPTASPDEASIAPTDQAPVTAGDAAPIRTDDPAPTTTPREETEASIEEPRTSDDAPITPEQLSTGPVLQWIEIDPGFHDLFRLESVGDGRVIARVLLHGDGNGLFDERVVVTSDGIEWTELPMPEGVVPEEVNISGTRWLVTGRPPHIDFPDAGSIRVSFSDDQGKTWSELVIDAPPKKLVSSPHMAERMWPTPALVSGERMVVVLQGYTTVDAQALLEDLDRLPDGKKAVSIVPWVNGVRFLLVDSDSAYSADSYSYIRMEEAFGQYTEDWLELTYDELGVAADEWIIPLAAYDHRIQIISSDSMTTELTAEYDGRVVWGTATAEGFTLKVQDGLSDSIISSPDGLVWTEDPSALDPPFAPGPGDGQYLTWRVSDWAGSQRVERAVPGEPPVTVATLEGFAGLYGDVGPGGLVAKALPDRSDPHRIPGGRVAKDGYELRVDEPDGGYTLWNLADDTEVFMVRPEDVSVSEDVTPPSGVRLGDLNGSFGVVFEDPETATDLVVFTAEDLAPVYGSSVEEMRASWAGHHLMPEWWVGWSADGTGWGWQAMSDAFEVGRSTAEFAVGRDVVIARVTTFQTPDPATVSEDRRYQIPPRGWGEVLPPRWFIARIPGS